MRRAVASILLLCIISASLQSSLLNSLRSKQGKAHHLVNIENYNTYAQRVVNWWWEKLHSKFDGTSDLTIYKWNDEKKEYVERVACIEIDDTCFKPDPAIGADFHREMNRNEQTEFRLTSAGSAWTPISTFGNCKAFKNNSKDNYGMLVCKSPRHIIVSEGPLEKVEDGKLVVSKRVELISELYKVFKKHNQ